MNTLVSLARLHRKQLSFALLQKEQMMVLFIYFGIVFGQSKLSLEIYSQNGMLKAMEATEMLHFYSILLF